MEFAYGRELGIHPAPLEVAGDRMADTSDGWPREGNAVVVVSRGSTDPDANADLFKVARLLWDGRGIVMVEAAFVSLADPSVLEAMERCRRFGATRLAIIPYVLFTGVLVDRSQAQATAWAGDHKGTEVRSGPELGPDRRLARLLLERYREAMSVGVRMNCDCCTYRIALPGYEDLVGVPLGGPGHQPGQPH